jgi:serine O-acetyltransferase
MRQSFIQTCKLVRQDIAARAAYEHKQASFFNSLKMMLNPGVVCVILFRFQVFFYQHYLNPLAGLLQYINLILFAVAIDSKARIGGGLVIIHANSVYVSRYVVAGSNLLLFHQNSIGFSPFLEETNLLPQQEGEVRQRGPLIGDNVIIGAGASVYGPVTIGDGSKIAVNAAVDTDCPPGSVMFGVPARQVAKA